MLHGLYWLAANFASRTPTLLVVDDLHWTDEPSLRWLHYLARRLEGLPLLLLTGTRPPEQANPPALVGELLTDPLAVVIRPAVLGRESAAALARERLGNEPAPAFAAALRQVREAIRSTWLRCSTRCRSKGSHRRPRTRRTSSSWVREQSRTASRRVSAACRQKRPICCVRRRSSAIAPNSLSPPLSPALDSATALTAASALVRADLLRNENPLEFTHPVVRTAVLETLSAAARAHAHRAAAEAILEAGGAPEQAATHLVLTVPSRDRFRRHDAASGCRARAGAGSRTGSGRVSAPSAGRAAAHGRAGARALRARCRGAPERRCGVGTAPAPGGRRARGRDVVARDRARVLAGDGSRRGRSRHRRSISCDGRASACARSTSTCTGASRPG